MKNITLLLLLLLTCWLTAQDKPEIFVQMGHSDEVRSVAFSPDDKFIISGSNDKTLKLWEVKTGREIRTFTGHKSHITSVAFSPDGKFGISGSLDYTLKLWEINSGKEIRSLKGHTSGILSVAFSPDGKFIITGSSDKTLKLWEVATGKEVRTINNGHTNEIGSVTLSSDGKYIVSSTVKNAIYTIVFWEVATGREIKRITGHTKRKHSDYVQINISPDDKYIIAGLFCGGTIGELILLDISEGKEIKTFNDTVHTEQSAMFSPNGKNIITASGWMIQLWEVATGKALRTWQCDSSEVNSVAFSHNGELIVSASKNRTIKIWNTASGKLLKSFGGSTRSVNSSDISSDGKYIVTANGNWFDNIGVIKLWEATTGKIVKQFTGHTYMVSSVKFSPDSKNLVSMGQQWNDQDVRLWDVANGKLIKKITETKIQGNTVDYSLDGKYIVSAAGSFSDGEIKIWNTTSSKEIIKITDKGTIKDAVFSPDGKYIAAAFSISIKGAVKIWVAATGKEFKTIELDGNAMSVAFSPDGQYIVSAEGGWGKPKITLWNVATGQELKTFKGHTASINSVAFSADGQQIVSASSDNTIKLWDVASGREIKTFYGHSQKVNSVVFSPDGKYIDSASDDGTTRRWNIATGEEIAQFISFTDGEWLTITPDGYFDCSPNGAKNINVRVGNSVYSIDNFFETYYRPDIVKARLSGESTDNLNLSNINDGIKTPPEVTISIQSKSGDFRVYDNVAYSDLSVSNGIIKVKVTAQDTGGGVKGVRLFNNGKIAGENIRGIKIVQTGNVYEQEFAVNLTDGENKLKAVGFSDDMTESNPVYATVTYKAAPAGKPDMYILTVGINEYKNSKYNLNYCVDDAQGFVTTITPKAKKIFGNVYTTTILNQEATKANLLQKIEDIKAKIKPSDVFTLFYAGHGIALDVETDGKTISEFFYVLNGVTQMSSAEKCAENGISGSEMKQLFAQIKAAKQVMFVDACNSGAFAAQFASRGAAEENALAKLSRATGSVIFASTTKEQVATEFTELKHGVFTFVVMEALSGKGSLANGQLTAKSIMSYVEDKIPEYSKKYKGEEQYPTTFMWGQDFPLGVK